MQDIEQTGEKQHTLIGGAGNGQGKRFLAEQVMNGVRRAELAMKLDDITEGDGNCWYRAIWSQLQRKEVQE